MSIIILIKFLAQSRNAIIFAWWTCLIKLKRFNQRKWVHIGIFIMCWFWINDDIKFHGKLILTLFIILRIFKIFRLNVLYLTLPIGLHPIRKIIIRIFQRFLIFYLFFITIEEYFFSVTMFYFLAYRCINILIRHGLNRLLKTVLFIVNLWLILKKFILITVSEFVNLLNNSKLARITSITTIYRFILTLLINQLFHRQKRKIILYKFYSLSIIFRLERLIYLLNCIFWLMLVNRAAFLI